MVKSAMCLRARPKKMVLAKSVISKNFEAKYVIFPNFFYRLKIYIKKLYYFVNIIRIVLVILFTPLEAFNT